MAKIYYKNLHMSDFCSKFAAEKKGIVMKLGDYVLISPEVTRLNEWTRGKVIEVESNPFVGTVISAETPNGDIYFNKESLFKAAV